MGDFFKPWRRKIGVLTLLMACVFIGLLIRSRNSVDLVTLYSTKSNYVFVSGGERCLFVNGDGFVQQMESNTAQRAVGITIIPQKHFLTGKIEMEWHWWPASSVEVYPSINDTNTKGKTVSMVSYWFIISPLTLVSAFLLLSKLPKSTSKKLTEPVPTEVA